MSTISLRPTPRRAYERRAVQDRGLSARLVLCYIVGRPSSGDPKVRWHEGSIDHWWRVRGLRHGAPAGVGGRLARRRGRGAALSRGRRADAVLWWPPLYVPSAAFSHHDGARVRIPEQPRADAALRRPPRPDLRRA